MAQNLISGMTSTTGAIWTTLQSISTGNTSLAQRITQGQHLLDARQSQLEQQFATHGSHRCANEGGQRGLGRCLGSRDRRPFEDQGLGTAKAKPVADAGSGH